MLDKRLVFKEIWRQEGKNWVSASYSAENMKGIKNSLNEWLCVLEQYLKVDPGMVSVNFPVRSRSKPLTMYGIICGISPNFKLNPHPNLGYNKKQLFQTVSNFTETDPRRKRSMTKKRSLDTICIQGGWEPKNGEPRQLPIYQSTTFKYTSSEQMGRLFDLEENGYFYTRLANPTNDAVAAKICELEGGVGAMLTSSGQAANFYAVMNLCQAGDHVVSSAAIYGGTTNLFTVTIPKMGVECTLVSPDATEEELAAAFRPNTKALFAETIANPALTVLDIEKFAKAAHDHGVPLIVDNTFATPINCRPFEWGADIVTHSTTKYMDGHAMTIGGCIVDSGNFDWEAHHR